MSDQYDYRINSAYSEGYDDGCGEYANANPYCRDEADLWEAYEEGYWEGVARKGEVDSDDVDPE